MYRKLIILIKGNKVGHKTILFINNLVNVENRDVAKFALLFVVL